MSEIGLAMEIDRKLIKIKSEYETTIKNIQEAEKNKSDVEKSISEINNKLFDCFEKIFIEQGHTVRKKFHYPTSVGDGRYIHWGKGIKIIPRKEFAQKYPNLRSIYIDHNMWVDFDLSEKEDTNILENIIENNNCCHYVENSIITLFSTFSEFLEALTEIGIIDNSKDIKG